MALASATQTQTMVTIPKGTFLMGSADEDADLRQQRLVRLRRFMIDRSEVTNADYAKCVAARQCRPRAAFPGTDDARQPVVGVSWFDAHRYCRFVGKALPKEAQWEKAARGSDGRRFPWGDAPDCARANFGNFAGSGACPKNPGRPEPVGQRAAGASPYGVLDMGGNVWEWVAERVLRGGGCCGTFSLPRTTERLRLPATYRDRDIGFRCAQQFPSRSQSNIIDVDANPQTRESRR